MVQIVLDNGIIQVTFSIPEGFIIGIRFGGIDNVLDVTNRLSDRGYLPLIFLTIKFSSPL